MTNSFVKPTGWKTTFKNAFWLISLLIFASIVSQSTMAITNEDKQRKIAEALFKRKDQIKYDYNNYKNCPIINGKNACLAERIKGEDYLCYSKNNIGLDGYIGGHAGWDAKTRYENDNTLRNATFYSLTDGQVIRADPSTGAIAVFDGACTILYLHASKINPRIIAKANTIPKGYICKGTPLGQQGMEGFATAEHVHVEVRKGETAYTSCGAEASQKTKYPTTDPVAYLYDKWFNGKEEKSWDVNQDGQVDLLDALDLFGFFGKDSPQHDVNCDGTVDLEDLADILTYYADVLPYYVENSVVATARSVEIEIETRLLANYPNPFNPETWMPYQLARPSSVRISIYAADGKLVRTLDLGHRPAGLYLQQNRAAYWDGRNALGEEVTSGLYFYTLSADGFSATRKMLINR